MRAARRLASVIGAAAVAYEPHAQLWLDHLVEPALCRVKAEEDAGEDAKDDELVEKGADVFALECIVEGQVPGVQPELAEGGDPNRNAEGSAR